MKTVLPKEIKTIEQAEKFLVELFGNNEQFHPEDDAHDIIFADAEVTYNEREQLNKLMDDIYSLDGDFDPCELLMKQYKLRELAEGHLEQFFQTLIDETITYFLSDYVEDSGEYLSEHRFTWVKEEKEKLYREANRLGIDNNRIHQISQNVAEVFLKLKAYYKI